MPPCSVTSSADDSIQAAPGGLAQVKATMTRFEAHYEQLFRELEAECGPLDADTLASIIGFDAGGPVSLSCIADRALYVTCELSAYPEQVPGAEGFNFELLVRGWLDEPLSRALLTTLGDLSMRATLGHGHTIDVSGAMPEGSCQVVRLSEFSRTSIGGRAYGIYEVVEADGPTRSTRPDSTETT